jgi:arginine/ornithine transport system permease protein
MNWEVIFRPESLAMYGEGIVTTLWLLFVAGGRGRAGLVFALALTGPWTGCSAGRSLYLCDPRHAAADPGLPDLLRPGPARMDPGALGHVWPWTHFKDPAFCALLAFSLNTAGYTAEMLAGAIRETNAGEIEAAQAFGMSRFQVMLRIVLPSAMRRTLPAYSNEVVMMLHSTSLASAVPGLLDVTAAASRIYSDFYLPFEAYLAAAAIYLAAPSA